MGLCDGAVLKCIKALFSSSIRPLDRIRLFDANFCFFFWLTILRAEEAFAVERGMKGS